MDRFIALAILVLLGIAIVIAVLTDANSVVSVTNEAGTDTLEYIFERV